MNPLSWILLGLVIGIGGTLTQNNPTTEDLLLMTLLSVTGAVLGGIFASLILGQDIGGFSIVTALVALAGALILTSFKKGGLWTSRRELGV